MDGSTTERTPVTGDILLRQRLRRARRRGRLSDGAGAVGPAAFAVGTVFIGLALLPRWAPMGGVGHLAAWTLSVGVVLGAAAVAVGRIRRLSDRAIFQRLSAVDARDEFLVAWELLSDSRAEDPYRGRALAAALARWPADAGRRLAPARVWGRAVSGGLAMLLGVGLLASNPTGSTAALLWPFAHRGPVGLLWVRPGTVPVARGEDVRVSLGLSVPSVRAPLLWVRAPGGPWMSRPVMEEGSNGFAQTLGAVAETLDYRFEVDGRSTRRFRLTPFDAPKLERVHLLVQWPAYTGKKAESWDGVVTARVPPSTRLRWSVTVTPADGLLRRESDPPDAVPFARDGAAWGWEETVESSRTHRLWARRPDGVGVESSLGDLSVELAADEPPVVDLLAPSEDLRAAFDDRIPLTVDLSDDWGLESVSLVWRVDPGPWQRRTLARYSGADPVRAATVESEWDLAPLGVPGGKTVEFFVSARDRRPARTATEGRSDLRRVLIGDYAGAHARLEDDLRSFRETLSDRRAEQSSVADGVRASTPAWGPLAARQTRLTERLAEDAGRFADMVERMKNDPLTDRGSFAEHRGILKNLNRLAAGPARRAAESMAARDAAAPAAAEEVRAQLDRLLESFANIDASQNERALRGDQADLARAAGKVEALLADSSILTEAQSAQLRALAAAMEKSLERIRERLQKLATAPAGDSSQAIPLRFDEVAASLKRLGEALERGDGADALAAAREMLDRLEKMEQALSSGGKGGDGGALAQALDRALEALDRLIRRQEELLSRTEDWARQSNERQGESQRAALDALRADVARWSDAVQQGTAQLFTLGHSRAMELGLRLGVLDAETGSLERVLIAGPRAHVPERLEAWAGTALDLSRRLEAARDEAAATAPGLPGSPEKTYNAYDGLARTLASFAAEAESARRRWAPPETDREFLDPLEVGKVGTAAADQRATATEARDLKSLVEAPARMTALLPSDGGNRLTESAIFMDTAAARLDLPAFRSAQENQERALALLRDARHDAEEARRTLSEMAGTEGMSAAPTLRSTGAGAGDTRLPRPDDFIAPRRFRQELLDSMKERYPKDHDVIIQDYYRRWAK